MQFRPSIHQPNHHPPPHHTHPEERIWAGRTPRRKPRVPDAPNYVFHENSLSNMRKMQTGCEIDENLANDAETWYDFNTNKPVLVRQRYAVVL